MLDKLIHVNHLNEVLDFNDLHIWNDDNDLRDYEWSVTYANDRITGFTKGIVTKTIPFVFNVSSDRAEEIKNLFYEHFEKDILSVSAGYFELNGYKLYCYLTKSVKSNYNKRRQYLELSVTITTDKPYWIKETTRTINFDSDNETSALRYAFTYPFVYTSMNSANIKNDNFVESDALIRIYGECENPLLNIGDNIYNVNVHVNPDEYIEIDTQERTIKQFNKFGEATNIFNHRNKDFDIFKGIPSGTVIVSANANFTVDITTIERRGEPKWI